MNASIQENVEEQAKTLMKKLKDKYKEYYKNTSAGFDKYKQDLTNKKQISLNEDPNYYKNKISPIIDLIFTIWEKNKKIKNNKIYLTKDLFLEICSNKLIKTNGNLVNKICTDLIKSKLIHRSSFIYPKSSKLITLNPISKCVINSNLSNLDEILEYKSQLIEKLINLDWSIEKEIAIYFYLKMFLLTKIPDSYFKYLSPNYLYQIGEKLLFIVKFEAYKSFTPIKCIILDEEGSKIIKDIFFNNSDNILDKPNYIFSKKINFYENKLKEECNSLNKSLKEINYLNQFDYLINNTPLKLTINQLTTYPKLSLLEVNYLYPNLIDKDLIKIEKKNMEIYRNNIVEEDEDYLDYEEDVEVYLKKDLEFFEKLKSIKKVPSIKKESIKYLNKWKKFLTRKLLETDEYSSLVKYLIYLLDKFNPQVSKKTIKVNTLKKYLHVIIDYCFKYFILYGNKEVAIIQINEDLLNNDRLTPISKRDYRRIINHYLKNYENIGLKRVNSIVHYNRSIIFEKELDTLISKLKYRDKNFKDDITKLRRIIYSILLYHTGLRKTELYTRMIKDIYYVGERKFSIDVNKIGVNKINKKLNENKYSLKNRNAVRRVEFEIQNTKHFNLVIKYLKMIEEFGTIFLFPFFNKSNTISKKNVMNINEINEINSLIQDITKRYTPIHSFRHTYITNELNKIYENENKNLKDIFELCQKVGHGEPLTTLNHYSHVDLIKLL